MLVSRKNCALLAKNLALHKLINVGKGMAASRALTGSLAAGLLEALIAAIYIDGGYEAARKFILMIFVFYLSLPPISANLALIMQIILSDNFPRKHKKTQKILKFFR